MTVISKTLEKRADTMEEPLVDNMVTEDGEKKIDLEAGSGSPRTTRYIVTTRVRPYYTLILILMIILLVATSLLGIFGTECLYEQYRAIVNDEAIEKADKAYHAGWTTISYNDGSKMREMMKGLNAMNDEIMANLDNEIIPEDRIEGNEEDESLRTELKQKFELGLDGDYEKIEIEEQAEFIHDFRANFTAIVNPKNNVCYVMPLDRNVVLLPTNMIDLLEKMSNHFYVVKENVIQNEMHVVLPALTDLTSLGPHIQTACEHHTTYMLEKYVRGIVKRSVDQEPVQVRMFGGSSVVEYSIMGMPAERLV